MPQTPPHIRELQRLDQAIRTYPDVAMNYVLRGEYWLKRRQPHKAIPDFEKAIRLAKIELEASDWEYREQAVLDRAEQGIRLAERFL